MRSHTINFSKQVEEIDQLQQQSIHSCSSSQGEVLENRQDSETTSSRSKNRARKPPFFCSNKSSSKFGEITNEERSALSSVSDTTTEEDVAHCLMMLSRDRWERRNDDDYEDSGRLVIKLKRAKVVRGKYRCETCNKLFKSYQALGGHRASYKKIKADVAARLPRRDGGAAEEKVHQCPFCDRVFASGQALGGHKRSHFMGASNFRTVSRIGEKLDIDLNLPAPVDDGDDGDEINFTGNQQKK